MNTELIVILMLTFGGGAIVLVSIGYLYYVRIWFRAYTAGVPVPLTKLFRLTARRLSAYKLVTNYARAAEEGVRISLEEFEVAYAEGADPRRIVDLMIEAHRCGRALTIQEAGEEAVRSGQRGFPAVNQEG